MNTPIVLIGPIGAGKSSLGKLLAETLNLPQRAMDDLRFDYYKYTKGKTPEESCAEILAPLS